MSAPKLYGIRPVNIALADAVDYSTYRLRNRFQKHKGKKAARTAKLAKIMETIMKPYKVDDSDPVTILSILGQSERACDSNGISEKVAMCLSPSFTARPPAASLTI